MVQVEVWSAGACNSCPGGQSVEERPSWLQQAAVATASASGGWPEQRLHAGAGCDTPSCPAGLQPARLHVHATGTVLSKAVAGLPGWLPGWQGG